MARFEVTAPDGGRYEITAPDSATDADIVAIIGQQFGGGQGEQENPVDAIDYDGPELAINSQIGLLSNQEDRIEALTRREAAKERRKRANLAEQPWYIREPIGAAQGAVDAVGNIARGSIVGSFLDEGAAKLAGLIPGGETEEDALARLRANDRIQREDHPVASTISKLFGALATGAPFIKGGGSLLGTVGRGAAVGTGYGASYGFGEGEGGLIDAEGGDLSDRLDQAETGALFGAGAGVALPFLFATGSRAIAPLTKHLEPVTERIGRTADDAADAILARKIREAGTTPRELAKDVKQMAQQDTRLHSNSFVGQVPGKTSATGSKARDFGNNDEMLADATSGLKRLTGSVSRAGGPGAERIKTTLDSRQVGPANPFAGRQPGEFAGQRALLEDAASRALTVKGAKGAHQTQKSLMAAQKKTGNTLYEKAYTNGDAFSVGPVITRTLKRIADEYPESGSIGPRLKKATRLFTRGSKSGKRTPVKDIRRFDRAKQDLDDMIDKAQRSGKGNLTRELTAFKRDMLDAVHAGGKNAPYQKARDAWGSVAENREAIQVGRSALKADSEITAETFDAMTPGQQQLFRVGFLRAISAARPTSRAGNDMSLLFQQQRVQELMTKVVPRSRGKGDVFRDRPERFGRFINREANKADTRNTVLGGTQTAKNIQDDVELAQDSVGELYSRFRQSPTLTNMIMEAFVSGGRRIFGYRKELGEALARRLMVSDPVERMKVLRDIARVKKPKEFQQFVEMLDEISQRVAVAGTRVGMGLEE